MTSPRSSRYSQVFAPARITSAPSRATARRDDERPAYNVSAMIARETLPDAELALALSGEPSFAAVVRRLFLNWVADTIRHGAHESAGRVPVRRAPSGTRHRGGSGSER